MQKLSKGLISGSTALLVLHIISTQDMYGYEMIKELDEKSKNVFTLKEGTLYPVLHGLEKDGFAISYVKIAHTGKKRKYYSITKRGHAALAQKKAEWKAFSEGVNNVIGDLSYAI